MLQVITADQLSAVDFEQHIERPDVMDCGEYDSALRKAGDEADKAGDNDAAKVCRLIAALCSMHFRPNDPAEPFAPMITWADGSRSLAGSDFNQEQLDAFKAICPKIENIPIRTRVADIIWTNDKQAADFGRVAIDGYVAMIDKLHDGTGTERFHEANPSGVTTEEYIERACIIARRTGWRKPENDPLRTATLACYEHAVAKGDGYAKTRFGQLVHRLRLVEPDQLVDQLTPHVEPLLNPEGFSQAEALQGLIVDIARQSKNTDAHRGAVSALVDLYERKADSLNMGILKTHAIQQAIDCLHGLKGFADKRSELHQKLKDAQINVMEEMGSFSHETDISELVSASLKEFEGLDLLDSLERLARHAYPPKPEHLIEEARRQASKFPLSNLFTTSLMDERGRTVATAPGPASLGESGEEVLRHKIIQHEEIRIGLTIGATWEPIREKLSSENKITPELIGAICSISPFVPQGAEHVFARGLHSFLHGDYLVASALLVPYLEQGLRSFVEFAGRSSTTIKPGGIETSIGLGSLLSNHRDVLETVFGKPIVFCIESMFVHDLGPKVRHRHCHGLLHDGFYYGRDSIYCCWLIYALVFLPLRANWAEIKRHICDQLGIRLG